MSPNQEEVTEDQPDVQERMTPEEEQRVGAAIGLSEEQYIAKVCHEVNLAYCVAIGDESQQPWDHAPDWQRESAVFGVRFHIENPNASPAASHESWLRTKREDGWAYGPTKNETEKLHPCMVDFYQLPKEQQIKDHLFRAVVHAMRS